jgi:exodeoxyribonuclease VII large subunit
MKVNLLSDKLDSNIASIIKDRGYTFSVLCAKLQAISPLNTLARGYSMVQDNQGNLVSSVDNIKKDDIINISLADGKVKAIVQETNKLGG